MHKEWPSLVEGSFLRKGWSPGSQRWEPVLEDASCSREAKWLEEGWAAWGEDDAARAGQGWLLPGLKPLVCIAGRSNLSLLFSQSWRRPEGAAGGWQKQRRGLGRDREGP